MKRESLENTIVVVTVGETETEVDMDCGLGNLDTEASECLLIGRAVLDALMRSDDGQVVEITAYKQ